MVERRQICCFSGHRDLSGAGPGLELKLEAAIRQVIGDGVRYFGAGGAMGFDALAARTVLRLKREYPGIRLILVLPCRDQAAGWPAGKAAEYEGILQRADKVVWLADRYYKGCMHARNRYLVDHSGVCICYCRHAWGGTGYTVDYCARCGVKTINLAAENELGVIFRLSNK